MTRARPIPKALRNGPFRTEDANAVGFTRRQLQGSRFRHHFRDVWSFAELPDSLELQCAAAKLALPRGAVICGRTAGRLYGLPVPDDGVIHVALPAVTASRPQIAGVKVHRRKWHEEHLRRQRGILVVRPGPLFIELAADLERIELIIAGDAMLRHGWLNREELEKIVDMSPPVNGIRAARAALPHLEPRSDSPPETRLRMLLVDAGLPRPRAGVNVSYTAGGQLAQVDLLYPAERIAIFYDGGHHNTDPAQIARDRSTDRALTWEGYLVLRYDKRNLFGFPADIVSEVGAALTERRNIARGSAPPAK